MRVIVGGRLLSEHHRAQPDVAPMPSMSKKRASRSPAVNLAQLYHQSQRTGRGVKSVQTLPRLFRKSLSQKHGGLVERVVKLEKGFCENDMVEFKKDLLEIGAILAEPSNVAKHEERELFIAIGGPEILIRMLLAKGASEDGDARTYIPRGKGKKLSKAEEKKLLIETLNILRELSFAFMSLTQRICVHDDLIVYLFSLLGEGNYFDYAAGLVEEMLAVREESFNLALVPRFHELLRGFSSRQFSFFCRILALVVFEPEDRQLMETSKVLKSVELLKLRRNRMIRPENVIDRNHAIVLGLPELVPRLVKLIQVQNATPPSENIPDQLQANLEILLFLGMNEENDWDYLPIEPVDRTQEREAEGERSGQAAGMGSGSGAGLWAGIGTTATAAASTAAMLAEFMLPPLSPWNASRNPPNNQQDGSQVGAGVRGGAAAAGLGAAGHTPMNATPRGLQSGPTALAGGNQGSRGNRFFQMFDMHRQMKALALAPHQVEVLFVLCTLLGGKRKADVQDSLASLGFIDVLSVMFDRLNWNQPPRPNPAHLERLHGPGCDCNSESAIRVQFLRLVHNYCDRDCDPARAPSEMLSKEERALANSGAVTYPPDLQAPTRGLLVKIIAVLMKEPHDSTYRFWLASCIETFLRGASKNEQVFVARTGLLRHLVDEVLAEGFRCAGCLQTGFDLLGELIKGNKDVLREFGALLQGPKLNRLMQVVVSHLVDSNVFIRAMLLSLEKLRGPASPKDFVPDSVSEPFRFDFEDIFEFFTYSKVRLLRDLMTVVSVSEVNHENICCLNTAVVIFVFAHRQGMVASIVQALKQYEAEGDGKVATRRNFRELLWFWREYYSRGRDRLSLECSSGVRFSEWQAAVELLCADDGSPTALLAEPLRLEFGKLCKQSM